MKPDHVLKVFLTVDTELWPNAAGWPHQPLPAGRRLDQELAADIHGLTDRGGYGLPYQLGVLRYHGLLANYFVEGLFPQQAGLEPLRHIVGLVQRAGQQVELHLHPEWATAPGDGRAQAQVCQYLCRLPVERQSALIRQAIANLRAAGAGPLQAFRAGSFGADRVTLRALAENGLRYDSSYSPSFPIGAWGQPISQPVLIDGVWEFPVSSFRDFPGHVRHAQLCACSDRELTHALESAWRARWPAFVIVLHSFEMVRKRDGGRLPVPEWPVIRRYERLCAFLGRHRERFQTALFRDWEDGALAMPATSATSAPQTLLRSRPKDTLARMAQQAWSQAWRRIS
ncbi:hypothetical protein [Rugamonas apoptosis]|uniref:Polysaccharide deacetylase n=1 Tax=Rugamonas apoptosis TaxID=2758570 RepID=A0A7W2F8W6_9BURK|nr:hypothetical protein [Rugamonas apoptosis]MBA5687276.1 hypothetical protein [Rugamonas apoptosis]